jgi:hypothetical protein
MARAAASCSEPKTISRSEATAESSSEPKATIRSEPKAGSSSVLKAASGTAVAGQRAGRKEFP